MQAFALNFRDSLIVNHAYGDLSGDLPLVLLSDRVGEVVAFDRNRSGDVCGIAYTAWSTIAETRSRRFDCDCAGLDSYLARVLQ
jgi:NADPH:quinone reductase-like Zn-dependent oxidoreductase